jgi:integrase
VEGGGMSGKYCVRVYDARTDARRDYYAETFEAAKQLKREKEGIRRTGGVIYTVSEWMGPHGRWLELFPRPKESTMVHNRERASRVRPRARAPQAHRRHARDGAGRPPCPPSATMVVRAAFNDAVKARQIDENPFAAVDVKKSQGRRGIVVLTEAEVRKLILTAERVHGDFGREVFGPMIAVAAGTGVRPGENFAITRDDIDLEAGELHVWRQWNSRVRKFTSTKGTRLERTVTMLPIAMDALKAMPLPG